MTAEYGAMLNFIKPDHSSVVDVWRCGAVVLHSLPCASSKVAPGTMACLGCRVGTEESLVRVVNGSQKLRSRQEGRVRGRRNDR